MLENRPRATDGGNGRSRNSHVGQVILQRMLIAVPALSIDVHGDLSDHGIRGHSLNDPFHAHAAHPIAGQYSGDPAVRRDDLCHTPRQGVRLVSPGGW